jgi:hypothetical protein
MRPGLERIEAMLDAIGRPEQAFTIAQVGGTNGKGSISAMLAAILQAAGRGSASTPRRTSPTIASASGWTAAHLRIRFRGWRGRPRRSSPGSTSASSRRGRRSRWIILPRAGGRRGPGGGPRGPARRHHRGQARVVVVRPSTTTTSTSSGRHADVDRSRRPRSFGLGVAFSARQDPEAAAVIIRRAAEARGAAVAGRARPARHPARLSLGGPARSTWRSRTGDSQTCRAGCWVSTSRQRPTPPPRRRGLGRTRR